jgi:hypothetical protein
VRIDIDEQSLEVRLAPWQKLVGLMRDVCIARADISDVRVVADPVREAMHGGIKWACACPGSTSSRAPSAWTKYSSYAAVFPAYCSLSRTTRRCAECC